MAEQIISKKCSKCKQIKPVSEFGKDSARKDGFCPQCKICRNRQAAEYRKRQASKEKIIITTGLYKKCTKCGGIKPVSEFYKRSCSKDGFSLKCKICLDRQAAEYRKTPKGRIVHNQGNRKYNKSEKGKVTKKRYEQSEKGRIARLKYDKKRADKNRRKSKYTKTLQGKITDRKPAPSNWDEIRKKSNKSWLPILSSSQLSNVYQHVEDEAKDRCRFFFRRQKTNELIVKFLMLLDISPKQVSDLNNEDMPFSQGEPVIKIRSPRTGELRKIFIPPPLETKIKAYYDEFRQVAGPKDPFLINEYGERFSLPSMAGRLKRIADKLGIEKLTPGSFKRTQEKQAGRYKNYKKEEIPWSLPRRRFIETNVDIPKDDQGKPDKEEVDYQIQLITNAHKRRILKPEHPEPIGGRRGAKYKYNYAVHIMRRRWNKWRKLSYLADLRPLLPKKKVNKNKS